MLTQVYAQLLGDMEAPLESVCAVNESVEQLLAALDADNSAQEVTQLLDMQAARGEQPAAGGTA